MQFINSRCKMSYDHIAHTMSRWHVVVPFQLAGAHRTFNLCHFLCSVDFVRFVWLQEENDDRSKVWIPFYCQLMCLDKMNDFHVKFQEKEITFLPSGSYILFLFTTFIGHDGNFSAKFIVRLFIIPIYASEDFPK